MSDARNIVFWDCDPHKENLCWTTIEEAVEMWADDKDDADLPETVVVHGFAHMELPSATRLANDAIEGAVTPMEEELGDPEGLDNYEPSEKVKAAALALADAIRAEFKPWMCEEIEQRTVTVRDYLIPRNAPLANANASAGASQREERA